MDLNKNYSNRIDLNKFFFPAKDYNYLIIKMNHFPNYYKGSDIDIFSDKVNDFAKLIFRVGNKYVEEKNYEIEVSNNKDKSHTYLDFYLNNKLDLRFDLYLPPLKFKNLILKRDLFSDVLKNKSFFNSTYQGKEYPVYIPSKMDDLLLRYFEYLEYHKQRPEKKKHLDYVLDKISSDKDKLIFADKLKNYIKIHYLPGLD